MSLNKNIIHIASNSFVEMGMNYLFDKFYKKEDKNLIHFHLIEDLEKKNLDSTLVVIHPSYTEDFSIFKLVELLKTHKILIIDSIENETTVLNVLEKGVHGYLTNTCDEDEVIHAINSIIKGEKFYCNKALDIIINKHLYKTDFASCDATILTEREVEIVKLLASGKSNKDTAEILFLSPHTVHTHRKNIMKKLGLHSISELTIYCISIGLIEA